MTEATRRPRGCAVPRHTSKAQGHPSPRHTAVPKHAQSERLSVAFFHAPNYDAEIKCLESCQIPGEPPKYDPIYFAAYYIDKLMKSRQTADS